MMLVTTIYTIESGFYGVIVTDIFQSICIWVAVVFVIVMTAIKTSGADIAAVASAVTGNQQWVTTIPKWKTSMPAGYENYSLLWLVGGFYLLKTIIQGMGNEQRSAFSVHCPLSAVFCFLYSLICAAGL